MRSIELLAPAGSIESFKGAVNAGADAVYLAGKKFGARAFANNFEEEELVTAIEFAHLRGSKVYVTINTLVFDDEVQELIEYTDFLVQHHVDALIIQDLGMMSLLAHRYPNMDLHASTQVNAMNVDQAKFLKELGVKRIILARETSIDTIRLIRKEVDIELEVFVHGALCVSYSGNCLFSSMIGGRSGNRGECAQSCRLPYSLLKEDEVVDDSAYLMSTKDLMTVEYIGELIDAGVSSMKIEGRMRKPEYVIQSVLSYKIAIMNHLNQTHITFEEEIEKLKKVFNRGYTEGYLFNAVPKTINNPYRPNHMGVEIGEVLSCTNGKVSIQLTDVMQVGDGIRFVGTKDFGLGVSRILKDDVSVKRAFGNETVIIDSPEEIEVGARVLKTLDSELEASLQPFLADDFKRILLEGSVRAFVNEPITLHVKDDQNEEVTLQSEYVIQKANSKPITSDNLREHFSKLGNTPFEWNHLVVESDDLGFIPVKVMSELRRQMVEVISIKRVQRTEGVINKDELPGFKELQLDEPKLIVKVETLDQFNAAIDCEVEIIYVDEQLKVEKPENSQSNVIVQKRRIWRNTNKKIDENLIVVSDIGNLYTRQNLGETIADEFFSVTNIYSAQLLMKFGAKRVTLSPELGKNRLETFAKNFFNVFDSAPNLEKIVYGREDLMISKYCPIAKTSDTNLGCNLCHENQYYLKDRVGAEYPLVNDGQCNIRVLHSKPLNLIDYLGFFKDSGIQTLRLNFTVEEKSTVINVIRAYQKAMRGEAYYISRDNVTTGRFLR